MIQMMKKKNDLDDETICNIKEDVNDNAEKDTYDDKKRYL